MKGELAERLRASIKKTKYKYFGDYEMSDDQREAVDTLVEFAEQALLAPAIDGREVVARKLCEQHGGDPEAIATDEHDCWDGPLWTAFLTDADAILSCLAAPEKRS